MPCIAVLRLNVSIAHSDDDLTPFGIMLYSWERPIPASPVILRGRGEMIVDQVSFIVVVLTSNNRFSAYGTIGLSCCCGLCDSFNTYPAYGLFTRVVRCFRRLLVVQD
eukprot:393566-Pyramimonas_sp.AAC.1